MCKDLSFVFAELKVTQMERRKVANYSAVSKQTWRHMSRKGNRTNTYPSRSREPECDDTAITKRANNGGEEILESLREQTNVLDEDEDVYAVVTDSHLDTIPYSLFPVCICLADVLGESPGSKSTFLLGQPFGGVGVVGKNEGSKHGKSDRCDALLMN